MEPGVDLDVLVADWTVLDDEWRLIARKRDGSRLVFALLLKSYGQHGRFLSGPETVSAEVVDFVARQIGVPASSLADYDWLGRTHRYHRAQIRECFGFRVSLESLLVEIDKLHAVRWIDVPGVVFAEIARPGARGVALEGIG